MAKNALYIDVSKTPTAYQQSTPSSANYTQDTVGKALFTQSTAEKATWDGSYYNTVEGATMNDVTYTINSALITMNDQTVSLDNQISYTAE